MLLQPGGAAQLGFVIPLIKIDQEQRLIYGRAAHEVPDNAREIMDYASAKPQFQAWSKSFEDATGGLSKGNIRVMHTKVAAGKVTDIAFNDDDKAIDICAKIVDDNEWQKVLAGVYTGFSVGGGYVRKWRDETGLTRYTPRPAEMSLVDNPCMPTCRFAELVKADGIVERIELHGVARSFSEIWASRPRSFADIFHGEQLMNRGGRGDV